MKITFHGAARTVTGSRHLLDVNGHRVLLDCGLYQGSRAEMARRNRELGFDPAAVDTVVLSHAHLDHCGSLPSLAAGGFSGGIHATAATADLSKWILLDSAGIQRQEARYRSKRLKAQGKPPVQPLYTQHEVHRARALFRPQSLGQPFEAAPGVEAVLRPAGHILGAAEIVLDLTEDARTVRLAFSGDLGRVDIPLLPDPAVPEAVDYLVMESTYGDREHASASEVDGRLRELLRGCCRTGGKVVIPSFAMGRSQGLIYRFHRMMDAGEIPRIPIYLDSPLAVRISRVYRMHEEAFDAEARAFGAVDRHHDLFGFPELHFVERSADSKALNGLPGPMIVISTSGMLTAGRILHHLANTIEDPNNTVLLVSWQAPGTLGRRLVEGADRVRIFGSWYQRRARVEVVNGLSAHADRSALVDYATRVNPEKGVFLVHGEVPQATSLAEALTDGGIPRVVVPRLHESFAL
jgi:metallo-beta-lactamase family protein